jgi:uncharacterized protein
MSGMTLHIVAPEADTLAWRGEYERSLSAPTGWWAASALDWLGEGDHEVASVPDAAVPVPDEAPRRLARLRREGYRVTLTPEPSVALLHDGRPLAEPLTVEATVGGSAFVSDPFTMVILRRGDRVGVRLFDARRPHTLATHRVGWFPYDAALRVEARFVAAPTPRTLPIVHVTGDVADVAVPGHLEFTLMGRSCRLTPFASPRGLHIVFRDATSGVSTYGAGRFLAAEEPVGGQVTLDFNRAYHPPCAHTPFATCPIPPLENRLMMAVEGGEREAAA